MLRQGLPPAFLLWGMRTVAHASGTLALVLASWFVPSLAHACQEPPPFAFSTVWPGSGASGVPTNLTMRVTYTVRRGRLELPFCAGTFEPVAYVLLPVGGTPDDEVALEVATSVVGEETRRVLTPTVSLLPLTAYELRGPECDTEEAVLTTFTTGEGDDTEAPFLPGAHWSCTRVYHDLEPVGTCETRMDELRLTTLTINPATDDHGSFIYLFYEDASTGVAFLQTHSANILAAELSGPPGDYGWAGGLLRGLFVRVPSGAWRVVAEDMAGNRSEPVFLSAPELCAVAPLDGGSVATDASLSPGPTEPVAGCGCMVTAPSAQPPLVLLALATLARIGRRRRGTR